MKQFGGFQGFSFVTLALISTGIFDHFILKRNQLASVASANIFITSLMAGFSSLISLYYLRNINKIRQK